jgi:Tol biopolymer transport system component
MKTRLFPLLLLALGLTGCIGNPRKDHRTVSFDISPDKKSIVFCAFGKSDSDLFLLDIATRRATVLTALRGNELTPHFSPDGKKVAFALTDTEYKSSAIYEVELASGKIAKILDNGPYFDYHPFYGKDNTEIYFNRAHRRRPYSMGGYVWDQWDLYKVQSGNATRLTNSLYYQLYPGSYSAATGDVYFSAYTKAERVYRLDSQGTVTLYREEGAWGITPRDAGSPIYIDDYQKDYDFEIYRAGNSKADDVKLTNLKSYLLDPRISHDGQDIYFLSELQRNRRYDLYTIKSDGTKLTKIVGAEFFDNPIPHATATPL